MKHRATLYPSTNPSRKPYSLRCDSANTIYESARGQGYRLPASCLNGNCYVCSAQLRSGSVNIGPLNNKISVVAGEPAQEVMLCQARLSSEAEFLVQHIYGPGELPLKKVKCQILSVACLKGNVYQVELQLPAGRTPEFFAGQYLALNLPDKDEPSYYSIASKPGLRVLSLHIQADPHLGSAVEVVEYLKSAHAKKSVVSVSLPFGDACLSALPERPLILVAAGTGFAQMKSIVEYLFDQQFSYPISLYWGVRKEEDMYLKELADSWSLEQAGFSFKALVGDIDKITASDHHNQLSDAVLKEFDQLDNHSVFVSGSPRLVFSAMDAFLEAGLPESQFFSDVLAYASREDY